MKVYPCYSSNKSKINSASTITLSPRYLTKFCEFSKMSVTPSEKIG